MKALNEIQPGFLIIVANPDTRPIPYTIKILP